MANVLLIGVAAGLASALLFASVASGSPLAIVLFYAAPLPILIAGMGWSHVAGLIAALVGAAGLGIALGPFFVLAFFAGIGLPAWMLAYLALLARPDERASGAVEWYPVGRIVFWSAIVAALAVSLGLLSMGGGEGGYRAALANGVEMVLRQQAGQPAGTPLTLPGGADPQRLIGVLAAILPPSAAMLSMLTGLINLWIAARIVRASGRLARPWPALSQIALPREAAIALAGAMALSFLDGIAGTIAGLFAATLSLAFALVGLAVVHHLTRASSARALILAGLYGGILVFGWPLVLLAVAGLADLVFQFRNRGARASGPPAANDQ